MNGGADAEQKPSVDEFAEVPGDMEDNGEFAADDAHGDDGDDVFALTGDDALDGGDVPDGSAPAQESNDALKAEPDFGAEATTALEAAELPGGLLADDVQADDTPADDVQADDTPADGIQADDTPVDGIQADDAPVDGIQANDAPAYGAQGDDAHQNDILDTPLPPLDELDPVQAGSGWFQGKTGAAAPQQAPVADDIAAEPLFNMLQSFFVSSSMNNSMADILEEIAYDIHKIKVNSASMAKSMELAANAIVKMSERSSNRNT
jgi:hypothetical protein